MNCLLRWPLPRVLQGVGITVALVFSSRAGASTVREATLAHLVKRADLVVEATPEEAKSVWEAGPNGQRIVTYTRLRFGVVAYGPSSKDLWVRTLGGSVGKIAQRVGGEAVLPLGERSLLFLRRQADTTWAIVEMGQGQYPLQNDEKQVPRVRIAATLQQGSEILPVSSGVGVRSVLGGKSLVEAIEKIRREHANPTEN